MPAGNSLDTATFLNQTATPLVLQDSVTNAAPDFYKIVVRQRGSLNVALTGLSADVNLAILDSAGSPVSVGGTPLTATNAGTFSELINAELGVGQYYIRVTTGSAVDANYTLRISGASNTTSNLLWRNYNSGSSSAGRNAIWLLNGTNFQQSIDINSQSDTGWRISGSGDFDNDGFADILWVNNSSTSPDRGRVKVWLMNDTTFRSEVFLESRDANWRATAGGDFDNDGRTDIVWRNYSTGADRGKNEIWLMNGTTVKSKVTITSDPVRLDTNWLIQGIGDFDNDGQSDLLWQSLAASGPDRGRNEIWLMNGTTVKSKVEILGLSDNQWIIQGTGDFNNDGSTDIFLRNYSNTSNRGRNYVWFMNGTAFSSAVEIRNVSGDWQAVSPFTRTGTAPVIDTAGDTLPNALDLGSGLRGVGNYRGAISTTDANDYYRFNITDRTSVTVRLDGLTSNLDLELLDGNGTLIQRLNQPNQTPETLTTALNGGTYYIRVLGTTGAVSPYNLQLVVNTLPVLTTNLPLSVAEGGIGTLGSSVLQVSDDDLPATILYRITDLPDSGSLLLNGVALSLNGTFSQDDVANNRVRYQHNGSEAPLTDSFSFAVTDQINPPLAPATFNFTITPVNDRPVITVPTAPRSADQGLNTLLPGISITDPDQTGVADVTISALNGVLTLNSRTGLTFATGSDGTDDRVMTFSGSLTDINNALRTLVYRSDDTFRGTETIRIVTDDNGNSGAGGVLQDDQSFQVTVTPVNRAPVITLPSTSTVTEDRNSLLGAITVSDPNGDTGLFTASASAVNGLLSLSNNPGVQFFTGDGTDDRYLVFRGSLAVVNAALSSLLYRSNLNYNGPETVTIEVSDDGSGASGVPLSDRKVLNITVNPDNDPPTLVLPTAPDVGENTTTNIGGIRIDDVDAGSGNLDVSLEVSNGVLTLGNTNGVIFVNGTANQTASLAIRGSLAAINLVLNSLSYRPTANYNGADALRINVNDNGNTGNGTALSATGQLPIAVLGLNSPPVINLPGTAPATNVGQVLAIPSIFINDPDAGNGTVSVTLRAGNGTLAVQFAPGTTPLQGTTNEGSRLTFNGTLSAINSTLATLTYSSNPGAGGFFDTIQINVSDLGNTGIGAPQSDSKTLFVNVGGAVNTPPVATDDGFTVSRNGTLTAPAPGVLAGDFDREGGTLSASLLSAAISGTVSNLNSDGSFVYTPNRGFVGTDSFIYRVTDGIDSSSATVFVTVTNSAPIVAGESYNATRNTPLTVLPNGVLQNDSDPESDALTVIGVNTASANGNVSFGPTGGFVYTPLNPTFFGTETFTYQVSDGNAQSGLATLTIVVAPGANTAPTVTTTPGLLSYTENGTTAIDPGLTLTDTDSPTLVGATVVIGGYVSGQDVLDFTNQSGIAGSFDSTNGRLLLSGNATVAQYQDALRSIAYRNTSDNPSTVNRVLTISVNDGAAANNVGSAARTISVTAVNDPPTAVNDARPEYVTSPNSALTITAPTLGVLVNDSDPETPNPLSLTAVGVTTASATGALTLNPNGTFVYTPNANATAGVETFTYRVSDAAGATSSIATILITVTTAANVAPTATNDARPEYATSPNSALTIAAPTLGVLANDSDPETPDPLSLTAVGVTTASATGALTLNPNGTFVYTPNANATAGVETFTYRVSDAAGATSSIATILITVTTAANVPPTAANDARPEYATSPNSALTITAPTLGVLANDSDPETPDPLSLTAVGVTTASATGALTLNPNGTFVYTPNANATAGVETFTYRVSDAAGATSSIATILITVTTAANVAPTATNDARPEYATSPNSALTITAPTLGVLANDSDPETPDPLSLTAVGVTTASATGALTLNPNGTFVYTPNANATAGVETFTYRVSDAAGATSSIATILITVTTAANVPPTAANDARPEYATSPNSALTIAAPTLGVLANDSDPETPDPLSLTAVGVTTASATGALTLNPNGTFVYTPNANATAGVETFTYRVSDAAGATSSIATILITVTTAANVAPTAANDARPEYATSPNSALTIAAPTLGVLANDSDPETPDPLSLTAVGVTTASATGALTLNPNGTFVYTPNANATAGVETFTYRVSDAAGATSSIATILITVTTAGGNQPPTAANDARPEYATSPNSALTITAPTLGVLANDSDPETPDPLSLTAVGVTTASATGALTLNPNGTFVYTPNANATAGVETFTYRVSDAAGATSSIATILITVTTAAANSPPTAVNDNYPALAFVATATTLSVPGSLGVLRNDTDPDLGTTLTATRLTDPTKGTIASFSPDGAFVYTPAQNQSGLDSFTYQVSDGTSLSTATVTITIRATNAAPVGNPDAYGVIIGTPRTVQALDGLLANDTDSDNDSLRVEGIETLPTKGSLTFNSDGSFVYAPSVGATGSDSFVYRVSDGLESSLATVSLTLTANVAPTAVNDPATGAYTVIRGTPRTVNEIDGLLGNDTDPNEGTTLTVVGAGTITTANQGVVALNPNGTFTYTPANGFVGADSFTYRVSDGGLTSTAAATVSLTVVENSPPIAVNDGGTAYRVSRNGTLSLDAAQGVLSNDSDPDGTLPQVLGAPRTVTTGNGGIVTLNADGSFVYTPANNYVGNDSFTYQATDGIAPSAATATVSLTVIANNPPTVTNSSYTIVNTRSLNVTAPGLLATATDPDTGDQLRILPGFSGGTGSLSLNVADGSFTYTPQTGFAGSDTFVYQVTDGLSVATATVTFSVTANAAPTAAADTYTVNRNNQLVRTLRTQGVLANDTDAENDPLTATIVSSTTRGALTFNPDGGFVYIPNAATTSGTDSFIYRVSDGFNPAQTATAVITINAASANAPVATSDTYSVNANSTLSVTATTLGVLNNDTDLDGDRLQVVAGTTTTTQGTVTLNSDGTFVYTPNPTTQAASDTFTYQVTDGVNTATGTVVVTIGATNNPPVINAPASQTGFQGLDVPITNVSIADPDAGNNPVRVNLTTTRGGFQLDPTAPNVVIVGNGNPDVTIQGTVQDINNALRNLRYRPFNSGFIGTDTITIFVDDQGFSGGDGATSQTATTTVLVNITGGPTQLSNINSLPRQGGGDQSSSPSQLTAIGNTLFFSADDGITGAELWQANSTGANQVADIRTFPNISGSSFPSNFIAVGNTLYFTADNGPQGNELWKLDLTTGLDPTIVSDIRTGDSDPTNLVNLNGTLYFRATRENGTTAIWRTDGTTVTVLAGTYSQPTNLTVVGNTLYFAANGGRDLWRSDGTTSSLIRSIDPSADISNLIAVGNALYFTATTANEGTELWRSDGTLAGTTRVTNINAGAASSDPSNLVNANGTLYFFANDGSGYGLWRVAPNGTVARIGVNLPSAGQPPTGLTVVGSSLYFVVDNGISGASDLQLWRSDGTQRSAVTNLNLGGNDAVSSLTNVNGNLYFVATDGTGTKLWTTNGTAAGTTPVSGVFTAGAPSNLTAVSDRLYFTADNGTNGVELWIL